MGNKFLKGAAILGVAGLVVKFLGIFFRIPVTIWIGASGMAYYNSVYPIYTFFLILSTAGIPVAISRMVSERTAIKNYAGAQRVFEISVWLLGGIGLISFIAVYFGAGFIENVVLANPGTKYALQAIAPSLLIVPIMAAYRGYFQGRQNMNPTAVSQLLEQIFRVAVGLLLTYTLMKSGNEIAAAGAIFGCTAGAFVGLVVVVVIYILARPAIFRQIDKNKENAYFEKNTYILKQILAIAIPITIGACILPLVNAIDSMVVMRRLQATGWNYEEAKILWGLLGGYCSSLVGMPQVFIQAIVMSLVPAIAASYRLGDEIEVKENINFSLRVSMLIAIPCATGLFSLSWPILKLLYSSPDRAEEVEMAAPILMVMSISIIFMSIMQTLTGALQGVDKQLIPVKNLAIGAVVKVVFTFILVGIHSVNVYGAPIGTIMCYITASVLNIRDIKKNVGVRFDPIMTFVKPLVCSAVMGGMAFLVYKGLFAAFKSNSLSCLFAILIAIAVYAVLVLVTKSISTEEISKLPKGAKIAALVDKFVR